MVACSLCNRLSPRISYTEPFSNYAGYIGFTACSSVKHYISGYDIFISLKPSCFRRKHCHSPSGKAFSKIIIAVSFKAQCKPFRYKSPKALTTRTFAVYLKRILFHSFRIFFCYFGPKYCAECPIGVFNLNRNLHRRILINGLSEFFQKHPFVYCFFKLKIIDLSGVKSKTLSRFCKWVIYYI